VGPLREFRPLSEQSHQLYGVIDRSGKSLEIEAGIGFGLTPNSDKVNIKLMLLWNINESHCSGNSGPGKQRTRNYD
jgi:hypothetical protein